MTGNLFCGMTFSLKNPGRRWTTRTRTSSFLLYEDHCRLRHPGPHRGHPHLHCGDLRLRRKGFRRGIHFFPVLYPLRFVLGSLAGGILSSQGWSVDHRNSRCGRHLHCQRPCIALRDGKLFQQCVGKGPAEKNGFLGRC